MKNTRRTIGIVTFWDTKANYGQILQAYALQAHLKKQGHSPFIIKYRINGTRKKRRLRKVWRALLTFLKIKKPCPFDRFRKKHFTFSRDYPDYESLKISAPTADLYIVGSDQVWNWNFVRPAEPYFLNFGENATKRVSYAASFGHTRIPESVQAIYKQLLTKLDKVSVREASGVNICKQAGYPNAQHTPDPTLLLDHSEWAQLCGGATKGQSNAKHAFAYTIEKIECPHKETILGLLKYRNDWKLTHQPIDGDDKTNEKLSVEGWMRSIRESSLMITNSFHGTVFSLIFQTNFIVLLTRGARSEMNDRIRCLLERLQLEDRILETENPEEINQLIEAPIDWNKTAIKLQEWQEIGIHFLDCATKL